MSMTHAILNSTSLSAMNIDALCIAGVATVDLDNGQLVTLKNINRTTDGTIAGYEYNVEPATADADNVWLVESPEVGTTLEMQIHDDPRYFYNPAGVTLSLRGLVGGVDCFEVTKEVFTSDNLPTSAQLGQYVSPDVNGKYGDPAAEVPNTGAYFRVEGLTTIACGMEEVPAVVLRCMANFH